MAKISGDGATINAVRYEEQASDPATPSAGGWKHYFKAGGMYAIDDAGIVSGPFLAVGAIDLSDLANVDAAAPDNNDVLTWVAANNAWESAAPAGGANGIKIISMGITGVLAAGSGGALGYAVPFTCTITNVRAMVGTAPTGAAIRVDIHKDGTTIFTDQAERPNIADGATVDLTNTPAVTAVTKDAVLRLYADSVGSTTPGADLHVDIEVTVP